MSLWRRALAFIFIFTWSSVDFVNCQNIGPLQNSGPVSPECSSGTGSSNSQLLNTLLSIASAKGVLPNILPAIQKLYPESVKFLNDGELANVQQPTTVENCDPCAQSSVITQESIIVNNPNDAPLPPTNSLTSVQSIPSLIPQQQLPTTPKFTPKFDSISSLCPASSTPIGKPIVATIQPGNQVDNFIKAYSLPEACQPKYNFPSVSTFPQVYATSESAPITTTSQNNLNTYASFLPDPNPTYTVSQPSPVILPSQNVLPESSLSSYTISQPTSVIVPSQNYPSVYTANFLPNLQSYASPSVPIICPLSNSPNSYTSFVSDPIITPISDYYGSTSMASNTMEPLGYGQQLPISLQINMPSPVLPEPIVTVVSPSTPSAPPSNDPSSFNVPPFGGYPYPIYVKGRSKSRWKNLLPILLLLFCNGGCRNNGGGGCGASPSNIPIPYPIPVPINNAIINNC